MRIKEKVKRQKAKVKRRHKGTVENPLQPLCLCACVPFLHFFLFTFAFCLATCFTSGCSRSDVPLAQVTGEVTFNGLPAPAEIVFEPDGDDARSGGRPSSAFAAQDGSFRLSYTADRTGAVIGRHRVLVKILRSTEGEEPRSFEEAVTPIKTARLVRHVHEGRNHFRFAVTY